MTPSDVTPAEALRRQFGPLRIEPLDIDLSSEAVRSLARRLVAEHTVFQRRRAGGGTP